MSCVLMLPSFSLITSVRSAANNLTLSGSYETSRNTKLKDIEYFSSRSAYLMAHHTSGGTGHDEEQRFLNLCIGHKN